MDDLQAAIERLLPPGSRVHVRTDEFEQCQVTAYVPDMVTERVPFSAKLLDDANMPAVVAGMIMETAQRRR